MPDLGGASRSGEAEAPLYAVRGCECRLSPGGWLPSRSPTGSSKGPRNFEWTATGQATRTAALSLQQKWKAGGGQQRVSGAGTSLGIRSKSQTAGDRIVLGEFWSSFAAERGQRSQKISGHPRCPDDQFGAHGIDWAIGVAAEFPPTHFPLRANSESRPRPSTALPSANLYPLHFCASTCCLHQLEGSVSQVFPQDGPAGIANKHERI